MEIEKEILLVPGKQDFPEWFKDKYRKWKSGDYVPAEHEIETLAMIEIIGLVPMAIPIRVVQYAVDGKVTRTGR